jgi:putative methyltransferase (TIGR04325 family)
MLAFNARILSRPWSEPKTVSPLHFRGKPLTASRVIDAIRVRVQDRMQPINEVRGVYRTFGEAERAAPRVKPVGYEAANAGDWYADKLTGVQLEDYPVLFWLSQALVHSRSIFEIGGHVGVAYYGFSQLLDYPADLTWTILDVPSVMAAGEDFARRRGRTNLRFATEGVGAGDGADIVLAAGSLQYLETNLSDIIRGWRVRPEHLLINITPVYDGPAYVTVQNVGSVYCAYRIFNRQELVTSLEALDYALVDSWRKPRALRVPLHPERSFEYYSGFYFRLQAPLPDSL